MLTGKHIILGISGGIAAYKSVFLLRLLIKAGAEVQVIITPNGKEFITPVTLSSLSGKPVISEFFTANTGQWNSHVDLGLWADAMIIAPATASTIAKMANGVADNMLITTYLSAKCPVFIAPAMDLDMMSHPSTQRNIALLESYGNHIIEAREGELASHLVGKGRMEEPERIVAHIEGFFSGNSLMAGKHILITAGPTIERIDPVRYISNFSTGKMGYALAKAAAAQGAQVTLVSGPVNLTVNNPAINVISVESASQMFNECMRVWPECNVAIMTAAVADYRPAEPSQTKIKREGNAVPTLALTENPDIAAALGACKSKDQTLVGFALETDHAQENGTKKIASKNLDMVVVNSLADKGAGFGTDTNKVTVITENGNVTSLPLMSKDDVASEIIKIISTYDKSKV